MKEARTGWLEERLGALAAWKRLRESLAKPVPAHVNVLFSLGTLALACFFLLAAKLRRLSAAPRSR